MNISIQYKNDTETDASDSDTSDTSDSDTSPNKLLWTDKYKPYSIDDMILSVENKNNAIKWINNFKKKTKNFTNCLLLHGPPGTGKTSLANILLKTNGYDIIEFNASDIRNQKVLKDKLDKINGNINIINFMCKKKQQIGIIIDELDGINTHEKGAINELISVINSSKSYSSPFICTTNTINKKIETLKKKATYIKLNKPSRPLIKTLITRIADNENIKIDIEIINLLINKSQLDFRRITTLMEYLFSNNKNKINKIEELLDNFDNKNIENTIFDTATKILSKYEKDFSALYKQEKTLTGFYIYENFYNFLINNKKETDKTKLDNIAKIYNNYSESDIIDKEIFINQNFVLYNYLCYYKCNIPSYIINKMNRYSYNKANNVHYSTLLNKTSLEYQNCKLTCRIRDFTNHNSIFIYLFDILYNELIDNENYKKVNEIINYYKIDLSILEKIIKYSSFHISNNKTNLAIKKKNEII
mgnify:CR=1 FL=1